jgi:hypothetical protein
MTLSPLGASRITVGRLAVRHERLLEALRQLDERDCLLRGVADERVDPVTPGGRPR